MESIVASCGGTLRLMKLTKLRNRLHSPDEIGPMSGDCAEYRGRVVAGGWEVLSGEERGWTEEEEEKDRFQRLRTGLALALTLGSWVLSGEQGGDTAGEPRGVDSLEDMTNLKSTNNPLID